MKKNKAQSEGMERDGEGKEEGSCWAGWSERCPLEDDFQTTTQETRKSSSGKKNM